MKLLLADDHSLVREGVRGILTRYFPQSQIDETDNYTGVFRFLNADPVYDLILVDYMMPDLSGQEALKKIHALAPSSPIAVFSVCDDPSVVRACLNIGVKGFITKSMSGELMYNALNMILAGGTFVPEAILGNSENSGLDHSPDYPRLQEKLTKRQIDVLAQLSQGKTNKEIGASLGLSEATIRTHLSAIFRILGVANRTQAGFRAVTLGLVNSPASRFPST